jgi:hypothetical protein
MPHEDHSDRLSFVEMEDERDDEDQENVEPEHEHHQGHSQLVVLDLPDPALSYSSYRDYKKRKDAPEEGLEEFTPRTRPVLLCLQENTAPLSPSPVLSIPPTPTTATSATFTISTPTTPAAPCSPSMPDAEVLEQRRKKMAKLTRHLGVAPPADLVFSGPKHPSAVLARQTRDAAASADGGKVAKKRARAQSIDLHRLSASVDFSAIAKSATRQGRLVPLTVGGKKDKEGGWVGHWNRSDIRTVQRQLRELKA